MQPRSYIHKRVKRYRPRAKALLDLYMRLWPNGFLIVRSKNLTDYLASTKHSIVYHLVSHYDIYWEYSQIVSKELSSIMLERMKLHVDGKLCEEQVGFRTRRSCADQIAHHFWAVHQVPNIFVSSIDHQVLWTLLRHYGLPEKFIRIIQLFYKNFSCQVVHGGSLTESFKVRTGIRQGCLLSPLLF